MRQSEKYFWGEKTVLVWESVEFEIGICTNVAQVLLFIDTCLHFNCICAYVVYIFFIYFLFCFVILFLCFLKFTTSKHQRVGSQWLSVRLHWIWFFFELLRFSTVSSGNSLIIFCSIFQHFTYKLKWLYVKIFYRRI